MAIVEELELEQADLLLHRLEKHIPINEFMFGHTRTQIEYFQTSNQNGDPKWEYWQHVLQLRSLYVGVKEQKLTISEIDDDLADAVSWWPFWSRKKRKRKVARLQFNKETALRILREKTNEIQNHLDVIDKKYSEFKDLPEAEILKDEQQYWTRRLGRQLGASRLSRLLGLSESEVLAVLALPKQQQQKVFQSMQVVLNDAQLLEETHD
jgi:hypothetical protein